MYHVLCNLFPAQSPSWTGPILVGRLLECRASCRCTLSKSVLCSFLFGKGSFQVFFCVVVHYIGCSKSELFCLFLFRRIDGCVDSIHLPSLARGGMLEVLIFQRAVTQVCLAYSMAYCEKHVVWINVTPPPITSQWHYLRQQIMVLRRPLNMNLNLCLTDLSIV